MTERPPNPFEILGIDASPAVTDDAVKTAWKRALFETHPDRNPDDPDADAKLRDVNEAYERLKTASQRESAAREFGMAFEPRSRSRINASFDDFFRSMDAAAERWKPRPYATGPRDGAHMRREMTVTLEQAFRGGTFGMEHKAAICGGCHGAGRIHTRLPTKCPVCRGDGHLRGADGMIRVKLECTTCVGRGRVTWQACAACAGAGQIEGVSARVEVPAGVDSGFEIKLAGLGAPGVEGGRAGDLEVVLRVLEHRVFQRKGADLLVRMSVPVWEAALGARRKVRGIDGRVLEFDVPAGCRNGQVRSLRGEGMSTMEGGRGNLLVKIDVTVPPAEGRMRELFEQMRAEAERSSEG